MTETDQWNACWLIIIFGMIFIFAFIAWQMSKGHKIDCAVKWAEIDAINRASEMRIAALLREGAAKGGNKVFAASDTKAMDEYPGFIAEYKARGCPMTEPRTFLVMPTYDGHEIAAAGQVFWAQSSQFPCMRMTSHSSLLCYGFNSLWAMALNHRNEGITHFAMLHADVVPKDPFWIDTMREMMDRTGVDVISAVVPIKSSHGLTSTALDTDPWSPRKLTLREIADLPVTFQTKDIPYAIESDLLINTGCMVVKFDSEWVERFHFHIADGIYRDDNGVFRARVSPEDWNFSRWLSREGIKFAATSAVKLLHVGTAPFSNEGAWGQESDMVGLPKTESAVLSL